MFTQSDSAKKSYDSFIAWVDVLRDELTWCYGHCLIRQFLLVFGGQAGWIILTHFPTNSFVGNSSRGFSLRVYRCKQQ